MMLEIFTGLILMIIPLFLTLFFKDKFRGFLTILGIFVLFHLVLAVVTQALHIFSYGLIIFTHFVVAFIVLGVLLVKRSKITKWNVHVNWLAVFVFIVIGFQFWAVHYSFTGTISTINGYEEVSNNRYIYPYYSDEWVGVSLINYSIENKALPLTNPLWPSSHFSNPTFPFFSFFSEVFLLLQVNPLTAYPALAILAGLLICLLSYLILRKLGVGLPASFLVTLSIPYIINGANLPGLWYFIPLIAGLIFFLFGFLSLVSNYRNSFFLYSVLSIIFYPPMIVFSLPIMIIYYLENRNEKGILVALLSLVVIFLIALFSIFNGVNFGALKDSVVSLVFRNNLQSGIPEFNIFTIIPVWILFFSVSGLFSQIKIRKYYLILPTIIGLTFWVIYSGTQSVFIIEYQRVIIVLSIILTIIAGLGLQSFKDFIYKKYSAYSKISEVTLSILVLLIFSIASIFYTRYSDWKDLVLQIGQGEDMIKIYPSAPANIYLTQEDLTLFENIREKRFITVPWKGLVIGVATRNYPLESKASTLTNRVVRYDDFIRANCLKKYNIAHKFNVTYVYSLPFNCQPFKKQGESSEGLVLYKFNE